MPSGKPGKIIFKGKIDRRLIPTDSTRGFEIVDAKVTESTVEVWLSDVSLFAGWETVALGVVRKNEMTDHSCWGK
jgi:hypothetical protein